jgi:hypothetical protein
MAKHFLVFLNGVWHRTNRLPVAKVAPPQEHQVKWVIHGWDQYVVCERKRLWRVPHINAQGRRKTWKEVLLIEKNEGYKGVNLWRDGIRHYYSVAQLRRLLRRKLIPELPDVEPVALA